jgi:plasmid maintenance system antidote protein VapI
MKKEKVVNDKTRNNIFAAAFDELKRNHGIKTQLELARRMGVNKDTITNILHYRTVVTEDIITRLQTASGCIFNLQWLRGESDIMLADAVPAASPENNNGPVALPSSGEGRSIDLSSVVNAMIAAKDETIASLNHQLVLFRNQLTDKDKWIAKQDAQLAEKNEWIAKQDALLAEKDERLLKQEELIGTLQQQVSDLCTALSPGDTTKYTFPAGVSEDQKRRGQKKKEKDTAYLQR